MERRNTESESVSKSMGKSCNIYENSDFNLNVIKVLFTEYLQYGQFSADTLSDLHTNCEKDHK